MRFVNVGDILPKNNNIFDTFELAVYLQMDNLKKWCLDQFTYSLTRDNVQTKFNQLKQLKSPVEEFEQRASIFVENISCGLYVMRVVPRLRDRSYLKKFSEETNSFSDVCCYYHHKSVQLDLHYLDNTLVICPSIKSDVSTESNIIMYDVITGKTKETKLSFEGHVVNCSSEKKIFVISIAKENPQKEVFSIETFDITSYNEYHSIKKKIGYSLIEAYRFSHFHFAQYSEDKIYVFYKTTSIEHSRYNINYMLIVCAKTMTILNNVNLANFNPLFGEEITKDVSFRMQIGNNDLYRLFYHKNENKLFIELEKLENKLEFYLVFDIKNQLLYKKENILGIKSDFVAPYYDTNISVNGDNFYGYITIHTSTDDENPDVNVSYRDIRAIIREEIRSFNYENETLVETGMKWKGLEDILTEVECNQSFYRVSTIFVENVKLD